MAFGPPVRIVDSTIAGNVAAAGPGVEGDGGGIYVGSKGRAGADQLDGRDNGAYTSGGGIFSDAGSQRGDQLLDDRAQPRRRRRQVRRHDGRHPPAHRGRARGRERARIANSVIALNTEAGGRRRGLRRASASSATGINLISTTNQGTCSEAAADRGREPAARPAGAQRRVHPTIALLPGSPAIGAAGPGKTPARDQRGVKRTDPDLGAYERR